jgi:hypothetical protein
MLQRPVRRLTARVDSAAARASGLIRAGATLHTNYDFCRDVKVLAPVFSFLRGARRFRGTIPDNSFQAFAVVFLDPAIALTVWEGIRDWTS